MPPSGNNDCHFNVHLLVCQIAQLKNKNKNVLPTNNYCTAQNYEQPCIMKQKRFGCNYFLIILTGLDNFNICTCKNIGYRMMCHYMAPNWLHASIFMCNVQGLLQSQLNLKLLMIKTTIVWILNCNESEFWELLDCLETHKLCNWSVCS